MVVNVIFYWRFTANRTFCQLLASLRRRYRFLNGSFFCASLRVLNNELNSLFFFANQQNKNFLVSNLSKPFLFHIFTSPLLSFLSVCLEFQLKENRIENTISSGAPHLVRKNLVNTVERSEYRRYHKMLSFTRSLFSSSLSSFFLFF